MERINLYSHQIEGIELLKRNKEFGLFWSCGVGKTRTVLQAIKDLNKEAIIIAPESGRLIWYEENKLFNCSLDIFNYSSFKKITNNEIRRKILVYDEGHALSHLNSARTKHALTLTDYFSMYILSGTICADQPLDLFTQLLLLKLREYSKTDWYRFRSKYAIIKKKMIGWRKIGRRSFPKYVQEIVGWRRLNELREEIAPKSSFLKLEQIQDMPPCTFIPFKFDLTPEEQRDYCIAKEGHLMKELELCSSFSSKRVKDILEPIISSGDKAAIFSGFLSSIKSLVREFNGIELIGETKDREGALKSFRGPNNVLCTTFHTGSESLNLQCANYEIFVDIPFYLLQFRQSLSRIYRTGQGKNCIYYILIPRGTIIERVYQVLQDKFELSSKIFQEENDFDILNCLKELR